jgi:hypothetical protein
VKLETGEYSTAEENKLVMMYDNTIIKKNYSFWFHYFLTVIARMHSDSADSAQCLGEATAMNFADIMRLTAKGNRIRVNCLKSKHSCCYDEMTT